jgi:hypothetical protein
VAHGHAPRVQRSTTGSSGDRRRNVSWNVRLAIKPCRSYTSSARRAALAATTTRCGRAAGSYPVICCVSAVAGDDEPVWDVSPQLGRPVPGVRFAAGRERLPWLWKRCNTAAQQIRASVSPGQIPLCAPGSVQPQDIEDRVSHDIEDTRPAWLNG